MSVPLIVAGVTYQYPTLADENWGTEATDWAVAITSVLNNLTVPGDLGPTVLVSIANNQSIASNVTNLIFDSATIRSAVIEYYVYRQFNSGTEEVVENGTLYINYKDLANEWDLVKVGNNIDGSGVDFEITSIGQITYTSSELLPSAGYTGSMRYRARVLQK